MTTKNNNNVTVNANAMTKEEISMKTKDQIRVALEAIGVEMSNTQFKKTKKAELLSLYEQKKAEVEQSATTDEPVVGKKERHVALASWAIVEASLSDLMAKTGIAKAGQKLFFKGKNTGENYIAKNTLVRRVVEWVIKNDTRSQTVSQEYVTKLLANIAGSELLSAYWVFEDGFSLPKEIQKQIKDLKDAGQLYVEWSGRKAMITATSIEGYLWLESLVTPNQKGYKGVAWKATSHQLNSMFKLVEEYKKLLNK